MLRSSLLRHTSRAMFRFPLRGTPLLLVSTCIFTCQAALSSAQQPAAPDATAQRLDQLSAAITQAQAQVDASERQLRELQQQLTLLRQQTLQRGVQVAGSAPTPNAAGASIPELAAHAELPTQDARVQERQQEQQAMQQSQIATLDQEKVESDSKYPVKTLRSGPVQRLHQQRRRGSAGNPNRCPGRRRKYGRLRPAKPVRH